MATKLNGTKRKASRVEAEIDAAAFSDDEFGDGLLEGVLDGDSDEEDDEDFDSEDAAALDQDIVHK